MTHPATPPPARVRLSEGLMVSERIRLLSRLGSGGMADVWVAEHLTLGIRVAVKFLRRPDDESMRGRLSREAQVAARLDHPHAVRVLDHGETEDGAPFLVMELIEGESLAARIARAGPLGIDEARRLVSQVAAVLAHAHESGTIHRDIKPSNIMLLADRDELFAKVVDFGIAKALDSEDGSVVTEEGYLPGTPHYMAPEQLFDGRASEASSDLWGLGLVAYEALVGRRPFEGRTRASVGLAIVMQEQEPPSAVVPDLPPALDDFFARALALDAADRFESARAFAEAFEAAAASPNGAASVRRRRSAAGLRIPDALYGRDRELGALRRAFARAAEGRSQVVAVRGYSGVGKTALVSHARRALVGGGGRFVSGKFDQFDRGTPYRSVVQALQTLVRRELRRDPEATTSLRAKIASELKGSGRALLEVIPELSLVLDRPPELEEVSPAEARARFQRAVARLASAMASPEHPLVMFLDDLQWADLPSIDLITSLATDPESRHVLLIGAYRDSEVDEGHPLAESLTAMRSGGAALEEITLGPLDEDAILDLVSDSFPGATGRARLATLCRDKTRGNAFFLRRFLESLYEEGALTRDPGTDRWSVDLSSVEARSMSEEVIDFVLAELSRLPEPSREALGVAAVIGDRFDLTILGAALGIEVSVALERLRPALASELITAPPEAFGRTEVASPRLTLSFAHDRIRSAARSTLADEEATRVHRVVGLYLLDNLEGMERDRRLFELVEHLSRGTPRGVSGHERDRLRALNLSAARRAVASAAFEPAHGYLRRAHALLADDAWTADYEQTLAIHVEGARAAYLSHDHETMEALVREAVDHGRETLDRVAAREVTMQARVSQQRFAEAVGLALDALAELGLEVPREPTAEDVGGAVAETLAALEARSPEAIARLPRVTDPRIAAIHRILNGTMSSAYLAAPDLLPILVCATVRSTLEHGVSKESPYGFAVFGLVLVAADLVDVAYATAKIATDMLERVDERSQRAKTLHVVSIHVNPFVEPIRDSIEADRRAVRAGMDSGDLEYAAWALHCMVANGLYAGMELGELERMFRRHRASIEHMKQLAALGCTVQYGQAVENLRGRADDPTRLVGPDYDEDEHMAELEELNFRGAAFILTTVGAFLRYLFGDLTGARELADRGGVYADGATATYHVVWWHQYRALAILGAADPSSPAEAEAAVEDVRPDLDRLRTWRRFSAVNHDHRVHLVEAELARVSGRAEEAASLYESAIDEAAEQGFTHEHALAHELAGRFHRARGDTERAAAHLTRAAEAYDAWGATAKVAALRDEA